MKLLDRYITRQFLASAFFSLLAVTVVFIVIDAMEKLDNFIDRQATTTVVLRYYFFLTPEIIKLITPVAMLLASLFVTTRLSTQNEITAMKSSGISLYRIMIPYLVVASLVTLASIYFNGWVVPLANRQKIDIEREYLSRQTSSASTANMYLQTSPTRILSMGYYDDGKGLATRVSVQDFSDMNLTIMTGRMDAVTMQWDSISRGWILQNVTQRTFNGNKETIAHFKTMPAGRVFFTPEDLRRKQEKPDEMDYYSLEQFIANQQRAGQDVARWLVDFHSKISFPFATVIVVLFGVPFSSVKRRSGVGVQLGISLLICFVYLIFMKVSQVFGYNGDANPLLTAWAANIIFFGGALVVIARVKK